jgi:hypothetical protein
MKPDLESVLGEIFYSDKYTSVCCNGIADKSNYILWTNVEEIYVGGSIQSFNGIPSGEDRTIRIIDSSKYQITFALSSFFRMQQGNKVLFSEVYGFILKNISARQWVQFIQKIQNGKWLSFQVFEISKDAFYFPKMFGGYEKKDIAYIKTCFMRAGCLYLQYQEPNKKLKIKNAGRVEHIPNIHLIQTYINKVIADKTKPS